MMTRKITQPLLLFLATASFSMISQAATQGLLDSVDSTGDFQITATMGDLIRISSLDDLVLPAFDGTNPVTNTENFCVYRNGTGSYTATVTGDGGDGLGTTFELYDGTSAYMAYTVDYDGTPILSGGTTATLNTANTSLTDCGGVNVGNNASVTITVAASVLQASPPGTYTGILTILVSPI